MKRLVGNLAAAVFGLLLIAGVLEIAMRILPVSNMQFQPVNAENPVLRFQPNKVHRWSKFADFGLTNTVRANNYGFINDQDYTAQSNLPLTAVVGDSYVEALMVPYAETVQGRLAKTYEGQRRVYSFAASGAPLSQYLAYAEYARDEFSPESFVFVVVGNDFDESHVRYKSAAGFHYFRGSGNQTDPLRLERIDWSPSARGQLVRKSRLALYLLQNVKILETLQNLTRDGSADDEQFAGNTSASTDGQRLRISKLCVDAFLARLGRATGVAPQRICLVVDSVRPQLYDDDGRRAAKASYFGIMRSYLLKQAKARSFKVVDMDAPFLHELKAQGRRFEFERDGHWNGYGHKIAADALVGSGFPGPATP